MKTAKYYVEVAKTGLEPGGLEEIIKTAQNEAYNQAINDAAEISQKPYLEHGMTNLANRSKQSILKLKR